MPTPARRRFAPPATRNFARHRDAPPLPDLAAWHARAYERLLGESLPALLREVFPIRSHDGRRSLCCAGFELGEPTLLLDEARRLGRSYARQLSLRLRIDGPEPVEQLVPVAELPIAVAGGEYLINGTPRVVIGLLGRAPGLAVRADADTPGGLTARIQPQRGSRIELTLIPGSGIRARVGAAAVPAFTLLRALSPQLSSDAALLRQFVAVNSLSYSQSKRTPRGRVVAEDIMGPTGEVLAETGDPVDDILDRPGLATPLRVFAAPLGPVLMACLEEDLTHTREQALFAVHRQLKPGLAPSLDRARQAVADLFSPPRYHLGRCGRARLNRAFGPDHPAPADEMGLRPDDLIAAIRQLLRHHAGELEPDDADHMANRRVRLVDDLLIDELRRAFIKFARGVRDRLQKDLNKDRPSLPAEIARHRALAAAIEAFFARGPLCQVVDQTNPLARLTHARRLTAAAPGGQRQRARYEARDVHISHHGRLCPVETPEGEAIGLVLHLALYAAVDDDGFLLAPYREVRGGHIGREVRLLRGDEEARRWTAPADVPHDGRRFTADWVIARREGDFVSAPAAEVDLLGVSPRQMVGVSAALIPFLEHDDANRALMGSNMQRQAVPLLIPEAPLVSTGLEGDVARQSAFVLCAESDGVVSYADAERVVVGERAYPLAKFEATTAGTCQNQRPAVRVGDRVHAGDVIADGAATQGGELALGRNLLVAFLSWEGHNFEDAIVLSERLVAEDVFTSLHIEELELDLRDRRDALTRDVPGVPARALVHLDDDGLARVGSRVVPGDVLVGKVVPRSRPEMTPERRLVEALLGKEEVDSDSLEVPPGVEGIVIGVHRDSDPARLPAGVRERVRVVLASKRVISVGDKMAGRHGNKGVISKILPVEDMPYMADGTPVDILLNPLGVPSRMNVGQIFETHLGWAAAKLGFKAITPVFDGASEEQIRACLREAGLPETGKSPLHDGRTGERFEQPVTVGTIYMLKLHHLVDDKVHARATGPYSLITQQPLGGKARFGGQRFGEMEVWALEAYGAAANLHEMMTIKSDDVEGRQRAYDALVAGTDLPEPGSLASVEVLRQELRGLGLDLRLEKTEEKS